METRPREAEARSSLPGPLPDELPARLEAAAAGLFYVSETEAPFRYVAFPGAGGQALERERLRALLALPAETPVAELPAERFFAPLVEPSDPNDPVAVENAGRFRSLHETLATQLTGLRAFRVGRAEVRYYLLGATAAGDVAGLATEATET